MGEKKMSRGQRQREKRRAQKIAEAEKAQEKALQDAAREKHQRKQAREKAREIPLMPKKRKLRQERDADASLNKRSRTPKAGELADDFELRALQRFRQMGH